MKNSLGVWDWGVNTGDLWVVEAEDGRGERGGVRRWREKPAERRFTFPNHRPIRRAHMGHGVPEGWGLIADKGERSFASANDAHLSDDEAVAKMGHPVLWSRVRDEPDERCLTG